MSIKPSIMANEATDTACVSMSLGISVTHMGQMMHACIMVLRRKM